MAIERQLVHNLQVQDLVDWRRQELLAVDLMGVEADSLAAEDILVVGDNSVEEWH